jgi:DNA-binding CsgD family transcriptional regulator
MRSQLSLKVGPRGEWREGLFVLTVRERQVLQLVADGLTSQEIAHLLEISRHTVESHRRHVYAKLGAPNTANAVAEGFRTGYVD